MAKSSQDSPRLTLLRQELQKWEAFNRLCHLKDYQDYLKPLLEQARLNKWPDPLQDKFEDVYKVEYGRATAYKEIQMLMDTAEGMIKNITKQMKDPEKNYEI
jgi:hypothetical protein